MATSCVPPLLGGELWTLHRCSLRPYGGRRASPRPGRVVGYAREREKECVCVTNTHSLYARARAPSAPTVPCYHLLPLKSCLSRVRECHRESIQHSFESRPPHLALCNERDLVYDGVNHLSSEHDDTGAIAFDSSRRNVRGSAVESREHQAASIDGPTSPTCKVVQYSTV